jgi:hypothetical protein
MYDRLLIKKQAADHHPDTHLGRTDRDGGSFHTLLRIPMTLANVTARPTVRRKALENTTAPISAARLA